MLYILKWEIIFDILIKLIVIFSKVILYMINYKIISIVEYNNKAC